MVKLTELIRLLWQTGMIIYMNYFTPLSIVVEDDTTDFIKIQQGVRQGCILIPLLFNHHSDAIFKEPSTDMEVGYT